MDRAYVAIQVAASLDGRISIAPERAMWEDMADLRLKAATAAVTSGRKSGRASTRRRPDGRVWPHYRVRPEAAES
ncbi:MAG: hypothetical protein AB1645_09765 [Bacillota bacterium]